MQEECVMGFFDSIKKAMGGKGDAAEASVKGPSMVLKEAGIDHLPMVRRSGTRPS